MVASRAIVVYRLRMNPDMDTIPVDEMSSAISTVFLVNGTMGSESLTVLGTMLIIRSNNVLHFVWKAVSSEMLCIVAFLSEIYSR